MKQKFPTETRAEVTSRNVDQTEVVLGVLQLMEIRREHGSLLAYFMKQLRTLPIPLRL